MKRKLSIFFWAIVSLLGAVAAVPPPIQYTPMTTNAPAGMTNAIRNIASTLSRDLNGNNKQITNVYLVGSQLVIASNLTAGNILLVTGPSYLSGPAYVGTIIGTNFVGNGVGLTNLTASATNSQNVVTPQLYGAVGNGVADDTLPILAAAAAVNSGSTKTLYFPTGRYRFGTPIVITNESVQIRGDGAMNTVLLPTNGTANGIEILQTGCAQSYNSIQDISLVGIGTNGSTKSGIYAGGLNPFCGNNGLLVQNVHCKQFADGLLFSNWVAATFVNLHSTGNRSNAFRAEEQRGNLVFINPEMGYSVAATSSDVYGYVDPIEGTNSLVFLVNSSGAGPAGINIFGGELGNSGGLVRQKAWNFTQVGGNMETFWGQYIYDFSYMIEVGIFGTRCSTAVNDALIPYHFVGGDMTAVKVMQKMGAVRTNILAKVECVIGDCTGIRRYPTLMVEGTSGVGDVANRIEYYFLGVLSSAVTNNSGSVPTLFEYNTWLGSQYFLNNITVSNGIITGDGSGLFNLPSGGINLYPFTNVVWFKNGHQTSFMVGADADAQTVTSGVDKTWNLVAPVWYDTTNKLMGLMSYSNFAPTNNFLFIGYANGLGAIMDTRILAATNSSEDGSVAEIARFNNSAVTLFRPLTATLSGNTLNPYIGNAWFQSGHQDAFKVGADDNATTVTSNTNKAWFLSAVGYGDTNALAAIMSYASLDTNNTFLWIGGANGLNSPMEVAVYCATNSSEDNSGAKMAEFKNTGITFYRPVIVQNAFSGWVTNVGFGHTNWTMYTNGIVWTNIHNL